MADSVNSSSQGERLVSLHSRRLSRKPRPARVRRKPDADPTPDCVNASGRKHAVAKGQIAPRRARNSTSAASRGRLPCARCRAARLIVCRQTGCAEWPLTKSLYFRRPTAEVAQFEKRTFAFFPYHLLGARQQFVAGFDAKGVRSPSISVNTFGRGACCMKESCSMGAYRNTCFAWTRSCVSQEGWSCCLRFTTSMTYPAARYVVLPIRCCLHSPKRAAAS